MSALGCFGRFTLFSPRVSHSNTCRLLPFVCFVLLFGFVALVCFCFLFFALLCFWFLFCKCLGIPNSPRSLDLDDRQGLIARSAMQQKKRCLSGKGIQLPVLLEPKATEKKNLPRLPVDTHLERSSRTSAGTGGMPRRPGHH